MGKTKNLLTILLTAAAVAASAQNDTLQGRLDNVVVVGHRYSSPLKITADGTTTWNMQMMADLPKILGNADPMHYTQLLPGVQTSSEYDAGMHVQGCESQHNMVTISGVPLYNVSHMLGFFSVFNASHFANMQLRRSPTATAAANRLGAELQMILQDSVPTRVNGELSVGPMSSQGTIRLPLGRKNALFVSARNAYLNLLYGQWLKTDEQQLGYTFGDYNATWLCLADSSNIIKVNGYFGFDRLTMDDSSVSSKASLNWGNYLLSAQWEHRRENLHMEHSLYTTAYRNTFKMSLSDADIRLPSYITDYAYKGTIDYKLFRAGTDIIFHSIKPQQPDITGLNGKTYNSANGASYRTSEYTLYASQTIPILDKLSATLALRGSAYSDFDNHFTVNADPSASLQYQLGERCVASLKFAQAHQYLFQTGFSNMGLPTEFWFSSNRDFPAQRSRGVSLTVESDMFRSYYHISAEIYFRKLKNQVEYTDNLFDLLYSSYDLGETLLLGRGTNYGINVMINKTRGRLTGWVSYSYGRALRRFDSPLYPDEYPANHERLHEFNAVASMQLGKRWSIGATFVFASGTPFTASKAFYIINSRLISEYGERNSNRLKPYCRLDLSANYYFKKSAQHESGINVSLYNALLHDNDLYYRLKYYENQFGYQAFRFIGKILPSINYFYKF